MAQGHDDSVTSYLYLNLAYECFNKAAAAEQAEAAEAFRRMGLRYISEAKALEAVGRKRGLDPLEPAR
jgi:hypothetical protein